MKRSRFSMAMVAAVIGAFGFFAFKSFEGGVVKGMVVPAEQATEAWAISGADTVKAAVANGVFELNVKPGSHTIIIDAKDPYKDVVKEGVEVADGAAVDLGQIALEQ
jgi:hypothetical protein